MVNKKIVCLGGGIGTVNLIRGLKEYFSDITVIVSMADDGGSTGRLRRLYNILPPGDLISCMAAVLGSETMSEFLTYRFPGERYGKDEELIGHRIGNLIMVAMRDVTGSFEKAVSLFQKVFQIPGKFYPVTLTPVSISAKTIEGKHIHREENIDRGRYVGKKNIEMVFLHPKNAKPAPGVIRALKEADCIIAGPGDLYTTVLPTLIVKEVSNVIQNINTEKFLIVNVANKPTETKGYGLLDYVEAVKRHLNIFPFNRVLVNNNFSIPIPNKYKKSYSYVKFGEDDTSVYKNVSFIKDDLIDEKFPLYHNSKKLAKIILKSI